MSALVDLNKYYAFLVAMFLMALSPGPANMFFVRVGLAKSYRRVLLGVVGVNLATLVWFIAAAFGLQVVMMAAPLLFRLIAIAGGLYLGWLSLKSLVSAFDIRNEKISFSFSNPTDPNSSIWSTFREGFMVQLLNPKITLFFSAVLPPFVDMDRPMPAQMVVFAATTIGMDIISMTSYGGRRHPVAPAGRSEKQAALRYRRKPCPAGDRHGHRLAFGERPAAYVMPLICHIDGTLLRVNTTAKSDICGEYRS